MVDGGGWRWIMVDYGLRWFMMVDEGLWLFFMMVGDGSSDKRGVIPHTVQSPGQSLWEEGVKILKHLCAPVTKVQTHLLLHFN